MANTIKVNTTTRSVQFGRDPSDYFVRFAKKIICINLIKEIQRNALDANARLIFGVAIFLACSILNVSQLIISNLDLQFQILSLMIIRRLKVTKTTSIVSFLYSVHVARLHNSDVT